MGQVLSGIIATFINVYPNNYILNYSYKEQLTDIMASFNISMIMGSVVYSINYLNKAEWQILIIQVFAGTANYIGLAKIFKNESYGFLLETVRQLILERRKASV